MPQLMFVDDEANVLSSFRRTIGSRYTCVFAQGAAEALAELCQNPEVSVIVTDMRMPGMDGIQLIEQARRVAPDASYLMLTGNADLQTAIDAVNRGEVFRFLSKPCPPEALTLAIEAALRQHQLVTSEQELLRKTLTGSVRLLTELLSLTRPDLAEHSGRVRRTVRGLVQCLELPDPWAHEVAALLSQVGLHTLPDELAAADLHRLENPADRELLLSHPRRCEQLLRHIPRLELPGRIIAGHLEATEPQSPPGRGTDDDRERWGSCVLRVALKFAEFYAEAGDEQAAREYVAGMLRRDCPVCTGALLAMASTECETSAAPLRVLHVDQLRAGMFTAAPVLLCSGRPLLGRGRELSAPLIAQIRTHADRGLVAEPLDMLVPEEVEATALPCDTEAVPPPVSAAA